MKVTELLTLHKDLSDQSRNLMERKNHDYTNGSTDPFANFRAAEVFGIDARVGLLVRLQDKLKRMYTFTDQGKLEVSDESVKDAVLDVINYAVLYYGITLEEMERSTPSAYDHGERIL